MTNLLDGGDYVEAGAEPPRALSGTGLISLPSLKNPKHGWSYYSKRWHCAPQTNGRKIKNEGEAKKFLRERRKLI